MVPMDESAQSINRSTSKKNASVVAQKVQNSISNAQNARNVRNNTRRRITIHRTSIYLYDFFFYDVQYDPYCSTLGNIGFIQY